MSYLWPYFPCRRSTNRLTGRRPKIRSRCNSAVDGQHSSGALCGISRSRASKRMASDSCSLRRSQRVDSVFRLIVLTSRIVVSNHGQCFTFCWHRPRFQNHANIAQCSKPVALTYATSKREPFQKADRLTEKQFGESIGRRSRNTAAEFLEKPHGRAQVARPSVSAVSLSLANPVVR